MIRSTALFNDSSRKGLERSNCNSLRRRVAADNSWRAVPADNSWRAVPAGNSCTVRWVSSPNTLGIVTSSNSGLSSCWMLGCRERRPRRSENIFALDGQKCFLNPANAQNNITKLGYRTPILLRNAEGGVPYNSSLNLEFGDRVSFVERLYFCCSVVRLGVVQWGVMDYERGFHYVCDSKAAC